VAVVAGCAVGTSCGSSAEKDSSGPVVTADPTDRPDDDAFAFSNTVEIRVGAVAPAQTVALVEEDIVLKNTTDVPQTVRVTNGTLGDTGPAETGPIAPGDEYRFRQTTPISIVYEITSQPGLTGRIQVDPGTDTI